MTILQEGNSNHSEKTNNKERNMRVTQINLNQLNHLNHCQVPKENGKWVADKAGKAAITVIGKFTIQEIVSHVEEGFVIAVMNETVICSCYAPLSCPIEQFEKILDELTGNLAAKTPVVIGGDFNAWVKEWGTRVTNTKS